MCVKKRYFLLRKKKSFSYSKKHVCPKAGGLPRLIAPLNGQSQPEGEIFFQLPSVTRIITFSALQLQLNTWRNLQSLVVANKLAFACSRVWDREEASAEELTEISVALE